MLRRENVIRIQLNQRQKETSTQGRTRRLLEHLAAKREQLFKLWDDGDSERSR